MHLNKQRLCKQSCYGAFAGNSNDSEVSYFIHALYVCFNKKITFILQENKGILIKDARFLC